MRRPRLLSFSGGVAAALLALPLAFCAHPQAATPPPPTSRAAAAAQPQQAATYVPEFGTMWTFDAPPLDYWRTRYNFSPDQAWLDHVRLSAVRLPGCSASFVSANGLVMTNHHCSRSCIAGVSPPDTNYMRTGYVAGNASEEKQCRGMYVDQLQSLQDVTAQVRAQVTATDAATQVQQRQAAVRQIQQQCQQSTGLNCQVVAFYQGGMYSLYRYRRFNDVRLVMAPEEEISFFGGDPDNFTYPRYDLDVSLLRVYEDGQPFHPKDYLRWSAAGAQEGELVFVVGNPGSTGRLLTMAQMEYLRDVQYPASLASLNSRIALYKKLSAESAENRRQYENTIFGLENSKKATTGYLAGLQDSTTMAKKAAFEKDFRGRINADPTLRAKFGGSWDAIASAEKERTDMAARARYYGLNGSTLMSYAGAIVRMAQAPEGAQGRAAGGRGGRGGGRGGRGGLQQRLLADRPVDLGVERMQLTDWLTGAQKDLPATDPLVTTLLAGRSPEAAANALIDGTKLGDVAVRRALVEGGEKAVNASSDPLIQAVLKLEPQARTIAAREGELNTIISANAEKVGQAIFAAYGKALPPDATFTLRISDGVVKGYPYNGTLAPYKTSFYGLFDRSTDFNNQPPFQLPERWLQHHDELDLSTPLNFVTTNDIIGGNSGSPIINRNAEVVGLIFDGNIEQLPTRFIFTDVQARSVAVASQAIPEALRHIFNAGRIADELQGRQSN